MFNLLGQMDTYCATAQRFYGLTLSILILLVLIFRKVLIQYFAKGIADTLFFIKFASWKI